MGVRVSAAGVSVRASVRMSAAAAKARLGLQTVALRVGSLPVPASSSVDTAKAQEEVPQAVPSRPKTQPARLQKSFTLHLGAPVVLPCSADTRAEAAREASLSPAGQPFNGVPLAALAESLGARVAPCTTSSRNRSRR